MYKIEDIITWSLICWYWVQHHHF